MRLVPWITASLFIAACSPDPPTAANDAFLHDIADGPTPWTHARFNDAADEFTFAVFSDLYGGERDGVFAVAAAQLELLRPELIVSIGDLIDGGTEDRAQLQEEWDEFDGKVANAGAPVFYAGGNHDLTNPVMRDFWMDRYGARYYHFVYKDVLFLVLDSEDMQRQRMQEVYELRAAAIDVLLQDGYTAFQQTEYFRAPERSTGNVSAEQADYFLDVIARHADVRWTFLFMHKPVWKNDQEREFQAIEAALSARPYTVINGHLHSYSLTERLGRDYITLGTTGGSQVADDDMAFDHVTLVAMSDGGPSIANLKLAGILDKSGHVPHGGDDLCFQASRCGSD